MHVVSQAFANMLSQKYLGLASFHNIIQAFASFRANSQIWFRSASQYFEIYGFASFRKVSQGFANGLSQGFASAKIQIMVVRLGT